MTVVLDGLTSSLSISIGVHPHIESRVKLIIIILVASFVTAFAQITSRLTSLETKDELMSADLLKKAEQTPKNLEIYMLIEMNAKSIEKLQASIESMIHNRLNIDFLKDQVTKLQKDVELLKDKVRNNGSN